jgi:hypothetical protein
MAVHHHVRQYGREVSLIPLRLVAPRHLIGLACLVLIVPCLLILLVVVHGASSCLGLQSFALPVAE